MRDGRIDNVDVKPGQTTEVTIPYGPINDHGEWLLNVRYVLKAEDGLLPAGHVVAHEQFALNALLTADMDIALRPQPNVETPQPVIVDNDANFIIVKETTLRLSSTVIPALW